MSDLAKNLYSNSKWEFETYSVKFETYLVKFETYLVIRDYETKKTAGAPEPPEPPSLAPMYMPKIKWHIFGRK